MEQMMKNRSGYVTGAGSGIGRASAVEFAKEGARVIVSDIDMQKAEETVSLIRAVGGEAFAFPCDISKEEQVEALIDFTISQFGRFCFAHNNAGIIPEIRPLADTKSENWCKVIDINLIGTYYCLKHGIGAMRVFGGGSIVCTSSVAGFFGGRNQSAYIASKWALNGLVKSVALEYARDNIRINAINPGATMTAMGEKAMTENPEQFKMIAESLPTGVMSTPENQAKAAVWLCASFNDQVTGTTLVVDGGYSAGKYNL